MNSPTMEPPHILDYAAVRQGFHKTYKQLMEQGKVDPIEGNVELMETIFIAAISWYVSGAQRPKGSDWKTIDNLVKQISGLTKEGNIDYALQYWDTLGEELRALDDKLTGRKNSNGEEGLCF